MGKNVEKKMEIVENQFRSNPFPKFILAKMKSLILTYDPLPICWSSILHEAWSKNYDICDA